MSKHRPDKIALDGLPARDSGSWAQEKLSFIDRFLPVALQATQSKRERHYVDLFAGPGLNIDRTSGAEFPGAAIRALRAAAPNAHGATFTHAHFVNLSRSHHAALRVRSDREVAEGRSRVPGSKIVHLLEDANAAAPRVLARIHQRAYAFVFADSERPEHWPWRTVEALRAHGHKSLDLCLLFPLHMALVRLIAYAEEQNPGCAAVLTAFFGSDEWKPIAKQRISVAQSPTLRRRLQELYVTRLERLWPHVHEVRDVRRRGEHRLYKLLYATASDAGRDIAEWEATQPRTVNQFGLGL